MTKRFGFTLAEVLITLGIIGVVAAMTIPNLIANTNGAKFRSQFKKTLSTLSQAGLMSQAQYDFDYAGTSAACTEASGASENPENVMTFCALFNGTLTGQTYVGQISKLKRANSAAGSGESAGQDDYKITSTSLSLSNAKPENYIGYTLADGSIVAFNKNASGCELPMGTQLKGADQLASGKPLANCVGFIDVNGVTLPNKEVTCSSGTTGLTPESPCMVKNDAKHMTDIFPVVFHDATVEPASNAAKYVLTTSK